MSTLTRAHYELIARVLRESPTLMEGERRTLIDEFAAALQENNERFVYGRFVAAATPDMPVPADEGAFEGMFQVLASICAPNLPEENK